MINEDEYNIILENLVALGAITSYSFKLDIYTRYRCSNIHSSDYLHIADFLVVLLNANINIFAGYSSKFLNKHTFRCSDNLTEITIPDTITYLDEGCFEHCARLRKIKLPSGLKCIPEKCFYNCLNLSDIVIPEGVESIKSEAFGFCAALHHIICPSSLKHIEKDAFYYTNIETIELNEGLEDIELKAFESSAITEITLPTTLSDNTLAKIITGSEYFDIFQCNAQDITIKVKTIEQYCFLLNIKEELLNNFD